MNAHVYSRAAPPQDSTTAFADALARAGIPCPGPIVADGNLHRYRTDSDRKQNCWYVLYGDGLPAGAYGCWKRVISETWCAKPDRELTPPEREANRRRYEVARAAREAEDAKRKAEAREVAAAVWRAATPTTDDHPYLAVKGVEAHGLRLHQGRLVVPLRDTSGVLHSLQFIFPNGEKRFLPDGAIRGHYHGIGEPNGVLCIAEGYATAVSVHEATGYAVAVAFNAGNLKPVAEALRAKYPEVHLIVCADNDQWTEGNPGLAKARGAGVAVEGLLAVPSFKDMSSRPTDFNDLARLEGLNSVQRCVDAAEPVTVTDASPVVYRRLSEIESRPIRWLWPGRIARGKVSLIAGHPGLGKSQITASLAAIVSTGGRWPVDRSPCERGSVVILSAEDDAADTIRPRLEAAGANLDRVYILDAVREIGGKGEGRERIFTLSGDIPHLGYLLERLDDVALVIIDPITAYLGDTDSHKNAEVRALLAPLAKLAERYRVAVVCVSHLNKGGGSSEALLRITGSLAFAAAARAAFIVARDPDNQARRFFLPGKNNLARDETGLAFTVEPVCLPGGIETSRVSWEAAPVAVTADEVLAPDATAQDRTAVQEAVEWLCGLLADGPLSAKDIQRQAGQAGIAWHTVRRAKDTLGIRPAKTRFDGGWEWVLPPKMPKGTEDAQSKTLGTFGQVGHLRDDGPGAGHEGGHVHCLDCTHWAGACEQGRAVSDPALPVRLCGSFKPRIRTEDSHG